MVLEAIFVKNTWLHLWIFRAGLWTDRRPQHLSGSGLHNIGVTHLDREGMDSTETPVNHTDTTDPRKSSGHHRPGLFMLIHGHMEVGYNPIPALTIKAYEGKKTSFKVKNPILRKIIFYPPWFGYISPPIVFSPIFFGKDPWGQQDKHCITLLCLALHLLPRLPVQCHSTE